MPLPNVQPCPRCGLPWVPWRGSKLKTHARCHFSDEEAGVIYDHFRAQPKLTVAKYAAELGVTTGVVRSTINKVHKQRGNAGRMC